MGRVNKTLEHFRLLKKNLIMAAAPVKPQVLWAQRPKIVFLTVNVADLKDPEIKVEKDSLYLKGVAAADKLTYEVTLKFLKEIDPETTKYQVRPRCIEFALEKKEEHGRTWRRWNGRYARYGGNGRYGWYAWYGRHGRYAWYGRHGWHAWYGRHGRYGRYATRNGGNGFGRNGQTRYG